MLEAVGLSSVDGDLYATLVRLPGRTAAELAEHCDLSARQAGLALSRLAARGLVSRIAGRPVRYQPIAPDIAVSALVADREHELRATRTAVQELMITYREAIRPGTPADLVEVIIGREAVADQVEQLHQAARSEIRVFDRPPYARNPDQHRQAGREEFRAGVRYQILYDRAAITWPGRLVSDILPKRQQGRQKVHARVRPSLPLKLFLADRQRAVIPVDSTGPSIDTAYVIHPSALLDALAALFEAEWDRATPVYAPGGTLPPTAPDDTAAALLALLSAGLTDEHIARSLGWSQRTAQRRVAHLMRELGATTRFQAALRARDLGWL